MVLLVPTETIGNLHEALGALDENLSFGLQIIVASAAALAAILSFLLLLLEVIPRAARGVQLTAVSGAKAELTIEAIVNRVRYEVESLAAVRQARPVVSAKGKEVNIDLEVRTDPTIDVAAKTQEVVQVVNYAVENQMGIKLRRLRVFIKHEPFPKEAKRSAPSQPAAAETTASVNPPPGELR